MNFIGQVRKSYLNASKWLSEPNCVIYEQQTLHTILFIWFCFVGILRKFINVNMLSKDELRDVILSGNLYLGSFIDDMVVD